ncbi:MAG: FMN-binding protein [Oscillospiraceae bacterium]|nr:FMN-binding protein [Oscillospiraceae bacterium]
MRKIASMVIAIFAVFALAACGGRRTELTDAEAAAIAEICDMDAAAFKDISGDVITKARAKKFPALDKVYKNGDLYAFIMKPIAYNGPVTLALVIDGMLGESVGMRIVNHVETPHYVRDMDKSWFTDRFAGKTVDDYLRLVRLEAREEWDIVAITGATVSTEGIINGVNAAFGAYREYVLGQDADEVPYMVRFEAAVGDGPVETGSIAIRAFGVVIAEVGIDDIREMPSVKRTMSIHSSDGVTQHNFRGTLLSNVLNFADSAILESYDRVWAVGVDDYTSGINMDEVRRENGVFVMYEDNDMPLMMKNGKPGAMRIVVIDDVFGQRFTNYLLEVVLE